MFGFFEHRSCKRKSRGLRFVVRLGAFVQQRDTPLKTPQFDVWLQRRVGFKPGVFVMAFKLTATQNVPVSLNVVDKKGNPAPIDGAVEFSTDNSDLLALTPNADGKSCLVSAVGPLGTAKVFAKADADLGEGKKEIIGFLEVEVTAGEATVVSLTPGTAVEQE